MENFEVKKIQTAKIMMRLGCECIGAKVKDDNFLLFFFKRNDETRKFYEEAKRILKQEQQK